MIYLRLALLIECFALPLRAETLRVVTDIAPIHSLVSQIMQGTNSVPQMLLTAQADPHDLALRPSQAQMLQDADLVIWIGAALSPWMPAVLDMLAAQAKVMPLLQVNDTHLILASEPLDSHDESEFDAIDPHAWLDPDNAALWRTAIAETLVQLDPTYAATYRANAEALTTPPDWDLSKLPPMLAEHDGLAYFAHHTGLRIEQTIHKPHDATPSIRDIRDLQSSVEQKAITCVLSDLGSDGRLLSTIFGAKGFSALPVVILGDGQDLGPAYYNRLLTELAAAIQSCAKG